MSNRRDLLSVRKDLLVAQSALYRSQLQFEVVALRERVTRGSTWISAALNLLSFVRTLRSVISLFRS